jgi:hypothetical protein
MIGLPDRTVAASQCRPLRASLTGRLISVFKTVRFSLFGSAHEHEIIGHLERNSRVFDRFATLPGEFCRKICVEFEL